MTEDPHTSNSQSRLATDVARSLRTWRALHRVKQTHLAELLRVSQSQVSRWENGSHQPGETDLKAILALVSARLTSGADQRLARFVNDSLQPMHLVCDLTHNLLAYSPARADEFKRDGSELLGTSLWPWASEDIVRAEENLETMGWYDLAAPSLELTTTARRSSAINIPKSVFNWTRFRLSDGSNVRLVETLSHRR